MLNIGVYTCIKNYIRIFINSRNNWYGSTCPYGQHTTLSPITYAMQGKVPYYRLWAPEQGGFGGLQPPLVK